MPRLKVSVRITDRSAYAEIKTSRGNLVAAKRGPASTIVRELSKWVGWWMNRCTKKAERKRV